MFGPVTTAILPPAMVAERSLALATNGSPVAFSAASTTGWRPPSMTNTPDASMTGRTQSRSAATSASAAATSIVASASAVAAIASASARIAAASSLNRASSRVSAPSAACAILASSAPSSAVEKRIASTMVWR